MSILKDKSDFNISSAKLLIDNTYYAPSVHCSYYSCMQLILHFIHNKLGISEEQLRADQKSSAEQSHEYNITLAYNTINTRNSEDGRNFNNWINSLKGLRNKADYKEVSIDFSKSNTAYITACDVIKILKKVC